MFDKLNRNNQIVIQSIITTLSNNTIDSNKIEILQNNIQKTGLELFSNLENLLNDKDLVQEYDNKINSIGFRNNNSLLTEINNISDNMDGPIGLD